MRRRRETALNKCEGREEAGALTWEKTASLMPREKKYTKITSNKRNESVAIRRRFVNSFHVISAFRNAKSAYRMERVNTENMILKHMSDEIFSVFENIELL